MTYIENYNDFSSYLSTDWFNFSDYHDHSSRKLLLVCLRRLTRDNFLDNAYLLSDNNNSISDCYCGMKIYLQISISGGKWR